MNIFSYYFAWISKQIPKILFHCTVLLNIDDFEKKNGRKYISLVSFLTMEASARPSSISLKIGIVRVFSKK
jgi:hypothetical protein